MNKKILFLILASVLFLPAAALAQAAAAAPVTLVTMAQAIAGQVLMVAEYVVVIMWVVTGIMFLTAQGNPAQLNTAKIALFAAIGGTIVVILASGAIAFVKNSFNI